MKNYLFFLLVALFSGCWLDVEVKMVNEEPTEKYLQEELKPFYHGVASGDPLSDRVIIWTRITPESNSEVELTWQVSETNDFSQPLKAGKLTTGAERDFTAKVDVEGLKSGTNYFYRFGWEGTWSSVGKTKPFPRKVRIK